MHPSFNLGLRCQLACIWEATARKPGNIHRFADFEDATYLDYMTSAAVLGHAMCAASEYSLGSTVESAVRLTRSVSAHNTNLGIALLLGPLAKADPCRDFHRGVEDLLSAATID